MKKRAEFRRFVDGVHRRRVAWRVIEGAGYAGLAGSVAGCGVVLVGGGDFAGRGGVVAIAVAVVVWTTAVVVRWPRRGEAVRIIDEQMGWSELLASAESCVASPQDAEATAALFARADGACRSTRPGVIATGGFTGRRWAVIGLGVAAAASVAVLLPRSRPTVAAAPGEENLSEVDASAADAAPGSSQTRSGPGSSSVAPSRSEPSSSSASSATASVWDADAHSSDGHSEATHQVGGIGAGAARDPAPAHPSTPRDAEFATVFLPRAAAWATPAKPGGIGPAVVGGLGAGGADVLGSVRGPIGGAAEGLGSGSSSAGGTAGFTGGPALPAKESAVPGSMRDLVRAFHDAGSNGAGG